jgi:hypothetical protein
MLSIRTPLPQHSALAVEYHRIPKLAIPVAKPIEDP